MNSISTFKILNSLWLDILNTNVAICLCFLPYSFGITLLVNPYLPLSLSSIYFTDFQLFCQIGPWRQTGTIKSPLNQPLQSCSVSTHLIPLPPLLSLSLSRLLPGRLRVRVLQLCVQDADHVRAPPADPPDHAHVRVRRVPQVHEDPRAAEIGRAHA